MLRVKSLAALCLLVGLTSAVRLHKSLDFIRQELAKNEQLGGLELKKYVQNISPAYIEKKGDRSLEQLTVNSIRENRFEYHRYLTAYRFHDVMHPDLPNAHYSFLAFSFILVMVVCLVLFTEGAGLFIRKVKDSVSKRINEISKDLLLLLIIAGMLKLIDYFRLIPVASIMLVINDIQMVISLFCVLYIIINLSCIVNAQMAIRSWLDFETYVPDRVEVFREFERMYIDNLDGVLLDEKKPKFEKLKKILKFISMRQEFISPTFIPLITEGVLRDDFRFADYLGKSYYKTLSQVASVRQFTMASFFTMIVLYLIVRLLFNENAELYVMAGLSLLFCLAIFVLKKVSINIFYRLSRPMSSPYEFIVQPFDATRDPLANMDKALIPDYLKPNFDNTYVSETRLINPQERLFLFSSPAFCIKLLHLCLFGQVVWMIIFATDFLTGPHSPLSLAICLKVMALSIWSMLVHFPATAKNFALITNIEMMKDQETIAEVISEQKADTSAAFCKFFRLVKRIKHEKCFGIEESSSDASGKKEENAVISIVITACRSAFNRLKNVNYDHIELEIRSKRPGQVLQTCWSTCK